jgi:hypothetical protein
MSYQFKYSVRKLNAPVTQAPISGFTAGFDSLDLAKEYARLIHDNLNLTYVFCDDKPVYCYVNNSHWGKQTEVKEVDYGSLSS